MKKARALEEMLCVFSENSENCALANKSSEEKLQMLCWGHCLLTRKLDSICSRDKYYSQDKHLYVGIDLQEFRVWDCDGTSFRPRLELPIGHYEHYKTD